MSRGRFIPAAIVIVVTVAAYLPILRNEFVLLDDIGWIERNPRLNPPSISHLIECWQYPMEGLYVPVTYTLWSALALLGMKPIVFHAASLVLHVMSALVVLRILTAITSSRERSSPSLLYAGESAAVGDLDLESQISNPKAPHHDSLPGVRGRGDIEEAFEDRDSSEDLRRTWAVGRWPATFGALLFALHPLQVESVAWASGMKDVLAGLLSLVMIDQYLRHIKSRRDSKAWHLHYAAAIAALLLGLLAKPTAIMAPAIAGTIDVMLVRKNWRAMIERLWQTALLIIPCLILARQVQPEWTDTTLWLRPLIAGDSLAFYLGKLFWPVGLTVHYGRTPQSVVASHVVYYMWTIPVLLGLVIFFTFKNFPEIRCGAVVFLLGLLPTLGFTEFMFQLNSTVADHYVYLAMLGPAIAVAAIIARAKQAGQTRFLACSALALGALLLLSAFQELTWKDSVVLYTQAVRVDQNNVTAHGYLGTALAAAGQYKEAVRHFRLVTEKNPGSPMGWIYFGKALEDSHELGEAVRQLSRAARQFPDDPTIAAELQEARLRLRRPATTRQ